MKEILITIPNNIYHDVLELLKENFNMYENMDDQSSSKLDIFIRSAKKVHREIGPGIIEFFEKGKPIDVKSPDTNVIKTIMDQKKEFAEKRISEINKIGNENTTS